MLCIAKATKCLHLCSCAALRCKSAKQTSQKEISTAELGGLTQLMLVGMIYAYKWQTWATGCVGNLRDMNRATGSFLDNHTCLVRHDLNKASTLAITRGCSNLCSRCVVRWSVVWQRLLYDCSLYSKFKLKTQISAPGSRWCKLTIA